MGIEIEKPGEACGVFAVYAPERHVAEMTYLGLLAVQHRGQEAAGIAVGGGERMLVMKDLGLANQVFTENRLAGFPEGPFAIGQVRYGTKDTTDKFRAAQPMHQHYDEYDLALAHNGHIENLRLLAEHYGVEANAYETDSELASIVIAKEYRQSGDMQAALNTVLPRFEGAFSLTMMTNDHLLAARDRHGFRPLMLGEMNDGMVVASEIAALDIVGAHYIRDVEPGEALQIDKDGNLTSWRWDGDVAPALCSFEGIYFSRPDNLLYGERVKIIRERMGRSLAERTPVEADVVIGVPESGKQAALGYSHASGIPFDEGFVKNQYVGRSFIQPSQMAREQAVRVKLNPVPEIIEGKSVVVVDDSIVRGTTTKTLVKMMREAGAREVHMRISSAPYAWPCFYGMDTGRKEELLASHMSIEEIRSYIDADTLDYLTPEDIAAAYGRAARKICMACMTGEYPLKIDSLVQ